MYPVARDEMALAMEPAVEVLEEGVAVELEVEEAEAPGAEAGAGVGGSMMDGMRWMVSIHMARRVHLLRLVN